MLQSKCLIAKSIDVLGTWRQAIQFGDWFSGICFFPIIILVLPDCLSIYGLQPTAERVSFGMFTDTSIPAVIMPG